MAKRIVEHDGKFATNTLILSILLGTLLVGLMIFSPESLLYILGFIKGSDNHINVQPSRANNYVPERSTPYPFPGTNQKIYTNSIGMEFVLIPAGEFDMGSPSDEWDRHGRESPIHKVNISYGFYLGKYEVTQKQWHEVMGDDPSLFKSDDRPVESVSWNQVQEFINKLNAKEGTDRYRLPSEAEWEYAARAGTTTSYSFGEWKLTVEVQGLVLSCISCSPQSSSERGLIAEEGEFVNIETTLEKIRRANELMLDGYAWHKGNSGGETQPVGQKKPNPWGLYDIHGNVWEWVQDSYHSDYKITPTDGSAWEGGDGWLWDIFGSKRVFRGGSWYGANCCRSALRNYRAPDERNQALGFRLLMSQQLDLST
ncbi:MAG: formylglycine-generating enzyme family protein [Candidatus Methanoperedens sp.]|nr:formylglycine-generating enzyme family protein [Candidatus Methanoperedens sp.]